MKRAEINHLFWFGYITCVVYDCPRNRYNSDIVLFDDIMPDEDEDDNDYTIINPEDLDKDLWETLNEWNLDDNIADLIDNGDYKVLHWADENVDTYLLVYDAV